MSLKITTWNINSVRLRLPLVLKFLTEHAPDILCLQETKCPDEHFPSSEIRKLGYRHVAISGQKGYHGVAILSRLPFASIDVKRWCDKTDCRHIGVQIASDAGAAAGLNVHNFYVPAGGDIPDPELNDKFAHKLTFLDELAAWGVDHAPAKQKAVMVGDLNVAPYEHDVWSHKQLIKVVSHTPIECEKLERAREAGGWVDALRHVTPEPTKIYTWWSYRSPDWNAADKGRRLDHVWLSPDLVPGLKGTHILRDARGWEQPSDHVPVTAMITL